MKVVSAEEMKRIDQSAIFDYGIPGVVLMENAGWRVVQVIEQQLESVKGRKVAIFAGKGNNGGDGFVVARHLANMGAEVKVLLLADPKDIMGDAKVNLDILEKMGQKVYPIINANSINIVKIALISTDLIVDAIYGTGFKGKLNNQTGKIFELINEASKPIVAIDIPSGVEANTGRVLGACIKAHHTVTMALPKIGLILEPGASYAGDLYIGDISIPPKIIDDQKINREVIDLPMVKGLLPRRSPEDHKGIYGHVLVIGGSEGMTGAVALTGLAALKIGAGLVTVGLPRSLNQIMEIKLTEVMTKPLSETEKKTLSRDAKEEIINLTSNCDVLALGPGLSTETGTKDMVLELVKELKVPLVIDADGLNILALEMDIVREIKCPLVLTPHPGEMARLTGLSVEEVQNNRLEIAVEKAAEWQAVIVLKGNKTVIATPEGRLYINPTGNPGMATGGSGDVLTGMIAALIGQGLSPEAASVAGTFLHGLAGDKAKADKGMHSIVAGDILDYISLVTKEL